LPANRTVSVKVVGDASNARKELGSVADAADKVHSRSKAAFSAITNMAGQAGLLGPLTDGIEQAARAFEHVDAQSKRSGLALVGVGAAATAAGLFMTQAASKDIASHNQLRTSIEATGLAYEPYAKAIEDSVKTQEHFGHAANDTQDALRKITTATGSPMKALADMGVVANLAAAQHVDLATAATQVTRVLAGSGAKTLAQYGIVMDHTKTKTEGGALALDQLSRKLNGQAAASVDSFSGRLHVAQVQIEDTANAIFAKIGPAVTTVGPLLMGLGAIMETASTVRGALATRTAAAAAADVAAATAAGTLAAAEEAAVVAVADLAAAQATAAAASGEMAIAESGAAVASAELAVASSTAAAANARLGVSMGAAAGGSRLMAGGMGTAGLAVAGYGIAMFGASKYQDHLLAGEPKLADYTRSLIDLGNAGSAGTPKLAGNLSGLADAVDRVTNKSTAASITDWTAKIGSGGFLQSFDLRKASDQIDGVDKALADLATGGHADIAAADLKRLTAGMNASQVKGFNSQLNDYKTATMGVGNAAILAVGGSKMNGAAISAAGKAADMAKKALAGYGGQLDILNGKNITAEEATIAFKQSLQDLPKALAPDVKWLQVHHKALDDNTDAGRRVIMNLLGMSKSSAAHAQAVAQETGKVEDGNKAMLRDRDALLANLKAHGMLTPAVQTLVDKYYKVNPATLAAAAAAKEHAAKVAELTRRIDLLKPKTVDIHQRGAQEARTEILQLQAARDRLEGKTVTISAQGAILRSAGFSSQAANTLARVGFADGGPVPMLPGAISGRDSVAAMLMPNEFIVKADGSNLGDAFAHYAKGYAAGGPVAARGWPAVDAFPQKYVDVIASQFGTALSHAVTTALAASMALSRSSIGGGVAGPMGQAAIRYASNFLGMPYVWGGESATGGFDCSGLMQYVWRHEGINLPRTASTMQAALKPEALSAVAPGDLLFWGRPAHHVAMAIGNGSMISADHPGTRIGTESIWPGLTSAARPYDRGGLLPTGYSVAYNGTGRPEPVGHHLKGGDTHIHVNVNVPPSADKTAVATEIHRMLIGLKRTNGGGGLGLT